MNPGLHEFHVPIDSTVESVGFSISVQCLQVADIFRPTGTSAAGEDVTDAFRVLISGRDANGVPFSGCTCRISRRCVE